MVLALEVLATSAEHFSLTTLPACPVVVLVVVGRVSRPPYIMRHHAARKR
jgi:hypothetical protein